ncbi:MAG: hypothetical protein ACJ75Q_02820 [Gaiellaceae bacterium]
MKGQFNSPVTLPSNPNDPVPVSGPLLQVDPSADEATIVCVLVQGELDDKNQNAVWVEGRGSWKKGETDWTGTVGREGRVIGGGHRTLGPGRARGIAVAVVVTEEEAIPGKIVPPSIDTLTWCVNIELDDRSAGTYQAGA